MKKQLIWAVILVIIIGGLYTWYGKKDNTAPTSKQQIKIGQIGILSGEYAAVGQNINRGIILAQEEYNASGAMPKIEMVTEDDAFDTKKGITAYQKLINVDKVDALINTSSPTINGIYDDLSKKNFPEIQFGNQSKDPSSDNVFQMSPGNGPLEEALGKYVKEKYPQNVAVFYGGDATFTKFYQDFKKGYGEGLTEYVITQISDDPRQIAAKMAAKGHEAVVIIAAPTSGARLIQELSKVSKKKIQYFFDANMQSGITDYQRILGGNEKLDGSLVMAMNQVTDPGFISRYEKRWGEKPGFWADFGYDGFTVLAKSYSDDGSKWIKNVSSTNTTGASGKIEFDDVGVLKPVFKLKQLQGGEFVDVK